MNRSAEEAENTVRNLQKHARSSKVFTPHPAPDWGSDFWTRFVHIRYSPTLACEGWHSFWEQWSESGRGEPISDDTVNAITMPRHASYSGTRINCVGNSVSWYKIRRASEPDPKADFCWAGGKNYLLLDQITALKISLFPYCKPWFFGVCDWNR